MLLGSVPVSKEPAKAVHHRTPNVYIFPLPAGPAVSSPEGRKPQSPSYRLSSPPV